MSLLGNFCCSAVPEKLIVGRKVSRRKVSQARIRVMQRDFFWSLLVWAFLFDGNFAVDTGGPLSSADDVDDTTVRRRRRAELGGLGIILRQGSRPVGTLPLPAERLFLFVRPLRDGAMPLFAAIHAATGRRPGR